MGRATSFRSPWGRFAASSLLSPRRRFAASEGKRGEIASSADSSREQAACAERGRSVREDGGEVPRTGNDGIEGSGKGKCGGAGETVHGVGRVGGCSRGRVDEHRFHASKLVFDRIDASLLVSRVLPENGGECGIGI